MSEARRKGRARLAALSMALVVGVAAAGFTEEAPADGQTPPPVPDKGTTSQLNCVDQKSEYTKEGEGIFYVQTFANKCEARLTCKVLPMCSIRAGRRTATPRWCLRQSPRARRRQTAMR